jgi:pimeloyl-ACP methyl ester carboxylesterase
VATASPGQAEPAPAAAAQTPPAPAPPKASIATSADGTRLAYESFGSGPSIVLLHGGGQTRQSWQERGYIERLRKQFRLVTMDLRGSGDSDRPTAPDAYALDRQLADVIAVADAAGVKRFLIWGVGYGAGLARYLAARSDRVISAILVSTTMGPAVTGVFKDAITAMRAKWRPLAEAQAAGKLDVKALSPSDRSAWEGGVAVSALSLGALLDYPPLEPAEIRVPALWLVGSEDTDGMANVEQYKGKLEKTQVTLKTLSSQSYSDSFIRIEPVLAEAEPFLAKTAGLSQK